ncbi:MAG: arabinose-5-phosphate isomerase [Alphaproteobacteria bacterium]|nr:MAG: arabinose-5-phosphate isomerase [Alphaproteobacteria bacterium]
MQIKETFLNLTKTYKNAINRLEKLFDPEFEKAVKLINSSDGHIVVCGMGKSGLVGRKISATLASTGTPSYFLHPGEAIHGDLGIVQSKSIIILISYSGETDEILALLPALKRLKVKIIAMTGELNSNLAKNSDIVLNISVDKEACPLNLAPTTSTLTTLIIGDALAVSLMNLKNFKQEDFALTHPGGSLGRRLLLSVKDEMITQNLPFVNKNGTMKEVVLKMTESRLGLALIGNEEKLEGIITDGDLRRSLLMSDDFTKIEIKDILNKSPMTAYENDNLQVAHERMKEARLQSLVVKNNDEKIVGVIQIFK